MLQRQASQSSTGPGTRNGLRRASSSASMTMRTFREQSPIRPATSSGLRRPPPVPPLPQNLVARKASNRRSISVEPAIREISPPVRRPSGRGVSLDRGSGLSVSHPSHQVPSLSSVPELEKTSSRSSINFSYPMNARQNSPRQSPVPPDIIPTKPEEQSPGDGLSPDGTTGLRRSASQAAEKPVKRKTKAHAPGSAEASYLGGGTADGHSIGTPIAAVQVGSSAVEETLRADGHGPAPAIQPAGNEPKPNEKKRRTVAIMQTYEQQDSAVGLAVDSGPVPKTRPSTVYKDHEGEERAKARETPGETTNRSLADGKVSNGEISTSARPAGGFSYAISQDGPLVVQDLSATGTARELSAWQPSVSSQDRFSAESRPGELRSGRPPSISPNRSARFSAQLEVTGIGESLHQPPPRSMSPVKSAMKQSSPQSLSPDRRAGIIARSPSEISDATSVASDDGSRVGSRRKAAKVSFDDEAEIVGAASPPTSPEEIVPSSLPEKNKPKTFWFGLGKKKSSPIDNSSGDGFDEFLKPRPALPSFGSIRGTREVGPERAKEVIRNNESTVSSITQMTAAEMSLSNDHAIGGILANAKHVMSQKRAEPGKPSEPLPPEVTSVEGNGYASDSGDPPTRGSDQVSSQRDQEEAPAHFEGFLATSGVTRTDTSDATKSTSAAKRNGSPIPIISIQPATPRIDEDRPSLECQRMPGGFPSSSSQVNIQVESVPRPRDQVSPAAATSAADSSDTDEESGESIYTDAAEHLSDLEGDGFGSINAIVQSSLTATAELAIATAPSSPVRLTSQNTTSDSVSKQGGSSVDVPSNVTIQSAKPASDQKELSGSTQRRPTVEKGQVAQAAVQESVASRPLESSSPSWPIRPSTTDTSAGLGISTSIPSMTKSMRPMSADLDEGARLRQALHSPDGQRMTVRQRQSMSASPTPRQQRAAPDEKKRPVSSGALLQNGFHLNDTGEQGSRQPESFPDALQRTGSDSSSSFKRSRHGTISDGQYTLRQTLRGGTRSSRMQSPAGRSASPGERRPFSAGSGTGTLRTTLRGPGGVGSQHERQSILSGFGRHLIRTKSTRGSGSQFMSRFDDSDDEGESRRRRMFRSRFEDSSDDEPQLTSLRPVRGIPRRQGAYDGDSTDLEDSSEDEAHRATAARRPSTAAPAEPSEIAAARVRGMTQAELEELLAQSRRKGKSGLFRRLTLSKRSRRHRAWGIHKSELESPARRDTPLERSRFELEQMRGDPFLNGSYGQVVTTVTAEPPPPSPKLQKRSSLLLMASDSWPLRSLGSKATDSSPRAEQEHDQKGLSRSLSERPQSSGGTVRNGSTNGDGRPGTVAGLVEGEASANRWSTGLPSKIHDRNDMDSLGTASDVVLGSNGRRKRFPLLRKAFGLRD
ncbi:hypothetical protein M432DRAFT_298912 [Thermoascus aurantiacus ATCC 26904]